MLSEKTSVPGLVCRLLPGRIHDFFETKPNRKLLHVNSTLGTCSMTSRPKLTHSTAIQGKNKHQHTCHATSACGVINFSLQSVGHASLLNYSYESSYKITVSPMRAEIPTLYPPLPTWHDMSNSQHEHHHLLLPLL